MTPAQRKRALALIDKIERADGIARRSLIRSNWHNSGVTRERERARVNKYDDQFSAAMEELRKLIREIE